MLNSSCISTYAHQRLKDAGFSDLYASKFSNRLTVSSYEPGQIIWRRGSPVLSWSGIINGVVASSTSDGKRSSVSYGLYGTDSWFGEYSILNKKPSYADFICLCPTDIVSVPQEAVHEAMASDPSFAASMAKLVAWRAQKSSEILGLMRMGNPVLRSVMGLYLFAEAIAFEDDRPPTVSFFESVVLPFKQGDIASLCGVSRTIMSDCLQKLAAAGWVKLHYGQVELKYFETWTRFASRRREQLIFSTNPGMDELLADLKSSDLL